MNLIKWLLLVAFALILQLFLPWWSVALAGFFYGFLFIHKPGRAFWGGFLGIFLLWGIMAAYIAWVNDGVLAGRLANLFSLPHGSLAVLATALTGGLAGGFAALAGSLFRKVV